jgi:prepilin-type N-terminal cleavage/methylation domain-containing protein
MARSLVPAGKRRQVRQPRRYGFTLVELLVVIAIIGTLVGLLLPAVQAVRESARRSSCSNNMKQIALALQNYHDARKCLPSGQTTSGPTAGKRAGWFVYLLPFVEYEDVYAKINWSTIAFFSSCSSSPVPVVWCPSDPYSRTAKPRGIYGNYSGNVGAMAID